MRIFSWFRRDWVLIAYDSRFTMIELDSGMVEKYTLYYYWCPKTGERYARKSGWVCHKGMNTAKKLWEQSGEFYITPTFTREGKKYFS